MKENAANYRLIAVEVGDALKYVTTVNQINRSAQAIFRFIAESFPNSAITSTRAQTIHDWILTLAKQEMTSDERSNLLIAFCKAISPDDHLNMIDQVLTRAGVSSSAVERGATIEFASRGFHPEVHKHSKSLFVQGNYFHAVFEACKAYNKLVQAKALSTKDGQSLMMEVWGGKSGVLKITQCKTETDFNIQDGVKFLSAGLMQAVRNPTAHEPAIDWPIRKQDCVDLLGFISFLFRQLDDAVYFEG